MLDLVHLLLVSVQVWMSYAAVDDIIVECSADQLQAVREAGKNVLIYLHPQHQDFTDLYELQLTFRKHEVQTKLLTLHNEDQDIISDIGIPAEAISGLFLLRPKRGDVLEYLGLKTEEEITHWTIRKQGALTFNKQGGLAELVDREKCILVGFFKDMSSPEGEIFDSLASDVDDISFFAVTDTDIMKAYRQAPGSIVMMKSFDAKETFFTETITKENLKEFIRAESLPLVVEFGIRNTQAVLNSDVLVHLLLVSDSEDPEHTARIQKLEFVAQLHRHEIIFVYVDIIEENDNILRLLQVGKDDLPAVYIFDLDKGARYMSRGDVSVPAIHNLITQYKAGTAKRYLLSEEVPDEATQDADVKTLVIKNLKDYVDESTDLFFLAYAPWCEKSKAFSSTWDKIGEHYKGNSSVVIAKMNVIANELPGVDIEAVPSIIFSLTNSTTFRKYHGTIQTYGSGLIKKNLS